MGSFMGSRVWEAWLVTLALLACSRLIGFMFGGCESYTERPTFSTLSREERSKRVGFTRSPQVPFKGL